MQDLGNRKSETVRGRVKGPLWAFSGVQKKEGRQRERGRESEEETERDGERERESKDRTCAQISGEGLGPMSSGKGWGMVNLVKGGAILSRANIGVGRRDLWYSLFGPFLNIQQSPPKPYSNYEGPYIKASLGRLAGFGQRLVG